MSMFYVCKQCGYYGEPRKASKSDSGNILGFILGLGIIAIFWYTIIGIIFGVIILLVSVVSSIGVTASKINKCPECLSTDVIPETSPAAKELLEKYHKVDKAE